MSDSEPQQVWGFSSEEDDGNFNTDIDLSTEDIDIMPDMTFGTNLFMLGIFIMALGLIGKILDALYD